MFRTSSGLTQGPRFLGVDLGELVEPDLYIGDQLGELLMASLNLVYWEWVRISGL